MPRLLLLSQETSTVELVSQLALCRGLTITALESSDRIELELAQEDVKGIFVDCAIGWQQHLKISRLVWENDPEIRYVAFSFVKPQQSNIVKLKELDIPLVISIDSNKTLIEQIEQLMPLAAGGLNPEIVLVESLPTPKRILQNLFDALGYSSFGTLSGEEGWQELNKPHSKYFLLITELRTKDISGEALIKRMRNTNKFRNMPVIVLSAHGTAEKLWDCLIGGASGFLVKPPKKALVVSELGRARRIWAGLEEPRLVKPEDAENVKQIMMQHGYFFGQDL